MYREHDCLYPVHIGGWCNFIQVLWVTEEIKWLYRPSGPKVLHDAVKINTSRVYLSFSSQQIPELFPEGDKS